MDNFTRFTELVNEAIALNLLGRQQKAIKYYLATAKMHGPEMAQLAAEYFTVRVDIGRRAGKTGFILKNCAATDVMIVGTHQQRLPYFSTCAGQIFTAGELAREARNTHRQRGLPPTNFPVRIYIDEPAQVAYHCPLKVIYERFTDPLGQQEQVFVLLGA